MSDTLDKLNDIYEKHQPNCSGPLHGTLWQIMMNNSCTGAFTYIYSGSIVGIALESGGYIPANFDIIDKSRIDEIIDDLNMTVFDLNPEQAIEIIAKSHKIQDIQ